MAVVSNLLANDAKKTSHDRQSAAEVLGACVVYLGGLGYFYAVDERCPIVSRIGTVIGHVHVTVEPFVAPQRANGTRDAAMFEPYQPPPVDKGEDQLDDFMDRTIEYRVTLQSISGLSARRHTRVSLRYGFFRDTNQHTDPISISSSGGVVALDYTSGHVVDVTEALIKYVASNNLMVEVFGWE